MAITKTTTLNSIEILYSTGENPENLEEISKSIKVTYKNVFDDSEDNDLPLQTLSYLTISEGDDRTGLDTEIVSIAEAIWT